jgi:hypothetical protein
MHDHRLNHAFSICERHEMPETWRNVELQRLDGITPFLVFVLEKFQESKYAFVPILIGQVYGYFFQDLFIRRGG